MSGIHVHFPHAELNAAVDAAALALYQSRRQTLDLLGIQLLQFAQLDYVTKARGGTGTDGVSWAPIKVSTILARLRKAGHVKSNAVTSKTPKAAISGPRQKSVRTVARTVKKNASLFKQLAKAGVKFRDKKSGRVIKGNSVRHGAGTIITVSKAVKDKTVKLSPGSYEIGVNTGLQRASSKPGFTAPDGKGGNVKVLNDDSITVGFGRSYSEHFDKTRKLFPDIIPPAWIEELEEIAAKQGGRVVAQAFDNKGVS